MKTKFAFILFVLVGLVAGGYIFMNPTQDDNQPTKFEEKVQRTTWTEVKHTSDKKSNKELHNSLTRHIRNMDNVRTASPCRDTDEWQMYVSVSLYDSDKSVDIVPNFESNAVVDKVVYQKRYECHSVTTEADYNGPAFGL